MFIPESRVFTIKDNLLIHAENVPLLEDNWNYLRHHEDFTCKVCSKVFITKDNLLNHEEYVHAENVP